LVPFWAFRNSKYELTSDAVDLGLDAALPPILELERQIGEFGRGERGSPSSTQTLPNDRAVVFGYT
jgi:hypothetical protein